MRILLTGISGTVGSLLAPELGRDHEVFGVDLRPSDWPNSTQADLCDPTALPPIFEGIDVVVHLAADPRHEVEIGWEELTNPNLIATARMYDAAHDAGVRRVIFVSSMHTMGGYEFDEPYLSIVSGRLDGLDPASIPLVKGDDPPRPDSRYGATKIFGESLGRYYTEGGNIDRPDERPMEVICVRLGTLPRSNRPERDYRSQVSWFSRRDAVGFFRACVEQPGINYEIIYGASNNTWKIYDTPYAYNLLNFVPADDASEHWSKE